MNLLKITITIFCFFLSQHTFATFLPSEKIPELNQIKLSNIHIEDNGSGEVKITATTIHTNDCFIPNSKVKTKKVNNDKIYYVLFGYNNEEKKCPTVMKPIYENVILDIISKDKLYSISSISVNNINLNL